MASADSLEVGVFAEEAPQGGAVWRWWGEVRKRLRVSARVRALVMLNSCVLLYASNVSVIKDAEVSFDPALFGAGRFAIATVVLLPFVKEAFRDPIVRAAGAELGMVGAAGFMAQSYGLLTTDAGRACVILSFTAVEVPLLAGLFGAKIPKVTWFGAVAAICGISLLENSSGQPSLVGDFWMMACALSFGICMLRLDYHLKRLPPNSAMPFTAMQFAVITAAHFVWILVTNPNVRGVLLLKEWPLTLSALSSAPWLSMAYTGVLCTALAWSVETLAFRSISATEAAMVYSLQPVYGSIFAWVLLGERWPLRGWVGAGLALGALSVSYSALYRNLNRTLC